MTLVEPVVETGLEEESGEEIKNDQKPPFETRAKSEGESIARRTSRLQFPGLEIDSRRDEMNGRYAHISRDDTLKTRGVRSKSRAEVQQMLETALKSLSTSPRNESHLNIATFIKIFLYHALLPLSFPFILLIDGKYMAHNLNLIPWKVSCWTQILRFASVWMIAILKFAYIGFDSDFQEFGRHVTSEEIFLPLIFVLLHALTIATKHGFQEEEFRVRMVKEYIPLEERNRIQLLGGWIHPNLEMLSDDLFRASRIMNIDLHLMKFVVQIPKSQFLFLEATGAVEACAESTSAEPNQVVVYLNAFKYSVHIAKKAVDASQKTLSALTRLVLIIAFILFFYNPLARCIHQRRITAFFGSNSWFEILTVCVGLVFMTSFCALLLLFDAISVIDYKRRYLLMRICKFMADPLESETQLTRDLGEAPVRIDLTVDDNILTWYCVRETFLHYGLQVRQRIDFYFTFTLMFFAIYVVSQLAYMIVRPEKTALVTSGVFLTILAALSGIIALMVIHGTRLNLMHNKHRDALTRIQVRIIVQKRTDLNQFAIRLVASETSATMLEPELKPLSRFRKESLQSIDTVIDAFLDVLDLEESKATVTILGLKIDSGSMSSELWSIELIP